MASISTHVLDVAAGRPAPNVRVTLYRGQDVVATASTDADGRVPELAAGIDPGAYNLVFELREHFAGRDHMVARVGLELELTEGHHHVPLLVSPYSATSYRGS